MNIDKPKPPIANVGDDDKHVVAFNKLVKRHGLGTVMYWASQSSPW